MTEKEALIMLNLAGNLGTIRLKKLLDYFDKPQKILNASLEKLVSFSGIGEGFAQRISALKEKDLTYELNLAKKLGIKITTLMDEDYPQNLRNIADPPLVLYIKGKIEEKDNLGLAIVGTRRPTFYGISSAEKFAYALAKKGFTIISGIARGIDTVAHRGALKAKGRTLAVMGSGFLHIYPPENKGLINEISESGAVISEFPLNTLPLKQNFPCRNRIISGLSLAVLVIEAGQNSGALITADFALEQGREVFALPGKIDSFNSFGTNELIKQGARLVSSVEDILEEFGFSGIISQNKDNSNKSLRPELTLEEKIIYDLIAEEPVSLEEIVEKTDLELSWVLRIILELEMKGLIKQLPGKQFVKE
ncbi:MAG: DNA-processing protein DprA [Candidatus Omnitrophica bacterium]|nr:DNA-processing protein DprA [Candidatus Omnitrophota bacterium]